MKKATALLFFTLALAFSYAQTITYSLEWIRPDSFFLVEKATQYFNGSPRPQEIRTDVPFRDTAALTAFVNKLNAEAADAAAELAKVKARSEFLNRRSNEINKLRVNGHWQQVVFVDPKPIQNPIPKPPSKPEKVDKKPKKKGI